MFAGPPHVRFQLPAVLFLHPLREKKAACPMARLSSFSGSFPFLVPLRRRHESMSGGPHGCSLPFRSSLPFGSFPNTGRGCFLEAGPIFSIDFWSGTEVLRWPVSGRVAFDFPYTFLSLGGGDFSVSIVGGQVRAMRRRGESISGLAFSAVFVFFLAGL